MYTFIVRSPSFQIVRRYAVNSGRGHGKKSQKLLGLSKIKREVREYKKPKKPLTFNYGSFGGLKELDERTSGRSSNLIAKIDTFDQLKLLPEVKTAAKEMIAKESLVVRETDSIRPSPIQTVSIKQLSKKLMDPKLQLHAIAAETGSGKTMAYALPLLDYLKRQETEAPELWEQISDKAIIRSVILVPTHELVNQVYETITNATPLLDLNAYKWGSGIDYNEFIEKLKCRIDVLVTTPAKLLNLFKIRKLTRPDKILSRVGFVVLDEADTLLDQSWVEETHQAIKSMPNTNHLIFCSATVPASFSKILGSLFPTVIPITTPRLHKLPKLLEFKIINASLNPFKGSKNKALAQILYAIMKDGTEPGLEKRCIIFLNEKKSISRVVDTLTQKYGYNAVGLTGDDSVEERLLKIQKFIEPPRLVAMKDFQHQPEMVQLPSSNLMIESARSMKMFETNTSDKLSVLVTTDLLARGLNFRGVKNVILYDVPKTSIDLIHRVGRTARMKQSGRVFMIIDNKTKSWAKGLPKIVRNNITLT